MKDKELREKVDGLLSSALKTLEENMIRKSRIAILERKVEKIEKKMKRRNK